MSEAATASAGCRLRVTEALFGPVAPGDYRAAPEDFVVEEVLGFAPEGGGEHLWLWVEKRGATTLEAVRELARCCGVAPRAVGYAGMKDRIAVTRQWLSVHLPGREAPEDLEERLAEGGCGCSNGAAIRASSSAACTVPTASRWCCPGRWSTRRTSRRAGAGCASMACPTPSARSASAPRGATWPGPAPCWPAAGASATTARVCCCPPPAASCSTTCWRSAWPRAAGTACCPANWPSSTAMRASSSSMRWTTPSTRVPPASTCTPAACCGGGRVPRRRRGGRVRGAAARTPPGAVPGLERAEVRLAHRPLRLRLEQPELTRAAGRLRLDFQLPRGSFATAVLRELMTHPTLNTLTPGA